MARKGPLVRNPALDEQTKPGVRTGWGEAVRSRVFSALMRTAFMGKRRSDKCQQRSIFLHDNQLALT